MLRCNTDGGRIRVCVPDCFVVPPVTPKEPPPFPGTVRPEDVRPPVDPPLPFLRPWAPHRKDAVVITATSATSDISIPCEIDATVLQKHVVRHEVEETIRAVFAGHPEDCKESFIQRTLASLSSPFAAATAAANRDDDTINDADNMERIVWTLHPAVRKNPAAYITASGGKKSTHRHDRILRGPAWSIISYGEDDESSSSSLWPGMIKRNLVYDGSGDAVAQVDFGHGDHVGIHCHALVVGSLDHKPGSSEDHMFPLRSVPWFWTCVPDVRSKQLLKRMEKKRLLGGGASSNDDDDDADASDFDDDANGDVFVSRDDVAGGRCGAAVFDRQRGAMRFGLVNTEVLDECSWSGVNLPYEDYSCTA